MRRVLILEDNRALARQWQHALEAAGMAVVLTETADDAIVALHETAFSAVVLDMFVVDVHGRIQPRGGLTVMGEIRIRIDRPPPIIIVSAAVKDAHLERMGILMNAYAVLSKPIENATLIATIESAIGIAGRD